VDSIFLLEEGFNVISTDASDKMLKFALKERWSRRREAAFDSWGQFQNKSSILL
jgi:glycine N-methyltransferase